MGLFTIKGDHGDVVLSDVNVTATLDWAELGAAFATADSARQAEFLDAVQTGFGDYASTSAELLQMYFVAEAIPAESRDAVARWLERMLDAVRGEGGSDD